MLVNEQCGFPASTRTPPPRMRAYDIYDDEAPHTNSHTSTRRYVQPSTPRTVVKFTTHEPIQRASRMRETKTEPQLQGATRTHATQQRHWLFSAGVVLFLMLLGWLLLNVIGNWWNGLQDDWQYGRRVLLSMT